MSSESFAVYEDEKVISITVAHGDRLPFQRILRDQMSVSGGPVRAERVPSCKGFYKSTPEFVLQNGTFYRGPWRESRKQGLKGFDQLNTISMCLAYGLRYVEGMALVQCRTYGSQGWREYFAPTWRAWNADTEGYLVDTTNCNGGLAYIGVEFSVDYAYDIWRQQISGAGYVIENEDKNWPILRRRWLGETRKRNNFRNAELNQLRGKPLKLIRALLKEHVTGHSWLHLD